LVFCARRRIFQRLDPHSDSTFFSSFHQQDLGPMETKFLEAIEKARESHALYLRGLELTEELWLEIAKLENLERIVLSDCALDEVPPQIERLTALRTLLVGSCRTSSFPVGFTLLKNLRRVSLERSTIGSLPAEFENLVQLEDLLLIGCPIKTVPTQLAKLPNLSYLSLANTKLGDFQTLGLLTRLKSLNLTSCGLTSVPEEVYELKNLRRLELGYNQLGFFPERLSVLDKLEDLDLEYNHIKEIPREVAGWKNLRELSVKHNPLQGTTFFYSLFGEEFPNRAHEIRHETLFALRMLLEDQFSPGKSSGTRAWGIPNSTVIHREDHLFVVSEQNHALLRMPLEQEDEFPVGSFHFSRARHLSIHVFGEPKTSKNILLGIRRAIEMWVPSFLQQILQEKDEKDVGKHAVNKRFVERRFIFPKSHERSFEHPDLLIDYDKLLKYKTLGENLYLDEQIGLKIAVSELIDYIDEPESERKEENKPKKAWQGSATITRVSIENFKLFEELSFDLSERFNIIIGRNALGKTSSLQAITLGLLPLNNLDKSNDFEDFIRLEKPLAEVTLRWGGEYRRTYVFPNELNEEQRVDFPQKLLLAYGVNLNTDARLDHSRILGQLLKGDARAYSTQSIFKDDSNDFFDPIVLLEMLNLENSKEPDPARTAIIDLLFLKINNFLALVGQGEQITLVKERASFFFKDGTGKKLKTKHLSEGYKNHVLLVSDIMVRILAARQNIFPKVPPIEDVLAQCQGVILIDEFDRHLHPVWQRRLLLQLEKDFPKIQFVLSTHNMLSLQSAEGFNALVLGFEEGRVTATSKPIVKGLSIPSIFRMYFEGKDSPYGHPTQQILNDFYELLPQVKKQMATEAELQRFKELSNQLLEMSEEVQVIVQRELRQMQRQTGILLEL